MNGVEHLVRSLRQLGIGHWFILPGELNEPVFASLLRNDVPFTMPRDERGAVFMADGYYRATGKVAAVVTAGGGGTTNMLAGLSVPLTESIPMLLLAINAEQTLETVGGWHDLFADQPSTGGLSLALRALTKAHLSVTHVRQFGRTLERALLLATQGRGGPVSLEIPFNLLSEDAGDVVPARALCPPSPPAASKRALEQAVAMLAEKRVAVLAGRGVMLSRAYEELIAFADRLALPVVTTFAARSAFPDAHPSAMGALNRAMPRVNALCAGALDVLIVLGAAGWEWDHRATFKPRVATIHVDIDPANLIRFDRTVGIVADCRTALEGLLDATSAPAPPLAAAIESRRSWLRELTKAPWPYIDPTATSNAIPLLPQRAIAELAEALPGNARVFVDIGEFTLATFSLRVREPGTIFCPIRSSHLGWSLPASIGAQIGDPSRPVVVLCGDGGMLTTGMELATAAELNVPVIVVALNNGGYNVIRKLFEANQPDVASRSDSIMFRPVDLQAVAKGLGCEALRATAPGELGRMLRDTLARRDRRLPTFVEVMIDPRPDPDQTLMAMRLKGLREAAAKAHG